MEALLSTIYLFPINPITVMISWFLIFGQIRWANSADPDKTVPSGSSLFAISFASFGGLTP